MMSVSTYLSLLATVAAVSAQKCSLQFDARVAEATSLETFDTSASIFDPKFVLGANLNWSKVLNFPAAEPSLFDEPASKPVGITIDDLSIFTPSPTNVQLGFRRAELIPVSSTGTDNSTVGVKTLHFSVKKDTCRPLNLTHEYQLVFLESADFSTNQFVLKTGTILGGDANADPDTLTLLGNVNVAPVQTLLAKKFTPDVWHNYGLVLNFTANTVQVLYSTGSNDLEAATQPLANDISGQGQLHFGVLKKPVGDNITDVTREGFQEAGINEGLVYGGIFEEDSADGCVSLGPDTVL